MTFEKSLRNKPAKVVERAREFARQIEAGATVADLGAKRMRHDRDVVSVRIGRSWRVIVDASGDRLVPVALRSHEDYSRGAKPR